MNYDYLFLNDLPKGLSQSMLMEKECRWRNLIRLNKSTYQKKQSGLSFRQFFEILLVVLFTILLFIFFKNNLMRWIILFVFGATIFFANAQQYQQLRIPLINMNFLILISPSNMG